MVSSCLISLYCSLSLFRSKSRSSFQSLTTWPLPPISWTQVNPLMPFLTFIMAFVSEFCRFLVPHKDGDLLKGICLCHLQYWALIKCLSEWIREWLNNLMVFIPFLCYWSTWNDNETFFYCSLLLSLNFFFLFFLLMAQHSTVRVRGGQVTCMWGTKILQLVFFLRLSEVECLEPFILLIWNAYLKNLIPNLLPLYFIEDVEELLFSPIWFSISPIRRYNLGRTKVYPLCEYLHIRWCSEQWVSAQAKNVLRIFPHCSSLLFPPHFQKGNAQLCSCFEAVMGASQQCQTGCGSCRIPRNCELAVRAQGE